MSRIVSRAARLLPVLLVCALWAGTGEAAGEPEAERGTTRRYLVVLRDRFAPGATEAERTRKVREPDFVALGGRVLRARMNRRLVELPEQGAEELRRHPDVAYLQRLWDGVPVPEARPQAQAQAAPRGRVGTTEGEPQWRTGEYRYDGAGNIKSIGTDEYAYDGANRLVRSTMNGLEESYEYDAFGNLRNDATGLIDSATNRMQGSRTTRPAR